MHSKLRIICCSWCLIGVNISQHFCDLWFYRTKIPFLWDLLEIGSCQFQKFESSSEFLLEIFRKNFFVCSAVHILNISGHICYVLLLADLGRYSCTVRHCLQLPKYGMMHMPWIFWTLRIERENSLSYTSSFFLV